MDFALTDEHILMRDAIRRFMEENCPPDLVREWDENHHFPIDIWRELGKQGWLGMTIADEYGGSGSDLLDIIIFSEELSYGMTGLSAAFQRSAAYGGMVIGAVGTEEQKRKHLPPLARGDEMVAIALTEPDAGSDAASLKTRATSDGGVWRINGQKLYTSGADQADWLIVAARTDPDAPPREGISTFIVPSDAEGIEKRKLDKLGNWTINTYEVFFDNVEVDESGMLGDVNRAWQTTLTEGLDAERLVIGSHCTGSAQRVFDVALSWAKEREQFGRPVGKFQLVKEKLVEMDWRIDAGRLITYKAAWMHDVGLDCRKESSQAKYVASEAWNLCAYEAMQIMGGAGYMMESEPQRHFRDARLYTIGGGTSEIQKLIIGHELGL